ncbi:MAG: imidazole glycerol phosphate synthase cyclase subunit [Gammaproteobacteria bacterium]|nr:imidazole glycerol phosphate synthase cyclase subunit [Gammaproteobacteria bacterium]
MSVAFRIIPKLDIKGPNLVKGINLEGLRVLGKPADYAKFYFDQGADELIYQDVVASLYGRNSLVDIISKTAKEIFIPLTVGGGIKELDDISTILKAGADKVSINTGAINNPDFISKAAKRFGSSTIVISIEAIAQNNGEYLAFTDNGRNETNKNVIEWSIEAEKLGAGEILITSVGKEGTGDGYDKGLISDILDNVSIPVVAHGGAGNKDHILSLKKDLNVSGVAVSSLFHYDYIKSYRNLEGYEDEGNTSFLSSFKKFKKVDAVNIGELKEYLTENSILLRTIN